MMGKATRLNKPAALRLAMGGLVLGAGVCLAGGCEEKSSAPSEDRARATVDPAEKAPATNPLAGSPGPSVTPAEPVIGDGTLVVSGVAMDVCAEWVAEPVSSSMRAAQYRLPAIDGESDAILAVFRNIGGTAEANISRWIGQIADPLAPPEQRTFDAGDGLTIHTVSIVGSFTVSPMMGGTGEPAADTMLLGAVITGAGDRPVFLKATGPRQTLERWLEEWDAMLASVRRAG